MYDDFTFNGRRIEEFGATAFLGDGFAVGDKITRSEYALPGGGSFILGDDRHGTIQRTIEIVPLDGVEDTAQWRRRILSWLQGSRGWLVFDHDARIRMRASFDAEGSAGLKVSPAGGLSLRATVFGVCESTVPLVMAAETEDGAAVFRWRGGSGIRTPLTVTVTPAAPLSSVTMRMGDATVALRSLNVAAAGSVVYRAEDGDEGAAVLINGRLDFSKVAQWGQLAAVPGDELTVTCGIAAHVRVEGREKWIVG